MNNSNPPQNQENKPTKTEAPLPTFLNCITGASISGTIAVALYFLTSSIAQTFANKPLASANPTAINISIAVRTLVVGLSTLATSIFGVIALGLVIVSIYALVQQLKKPTTPST
jgi:Protein of unknown function (DUF3082)